jgi:hypothetical protein
MAISNPARTFACLVAGLSLLACDSAGHTSSALDASVPAATTKEADAKLGADSGPAPIVDAASTDEASPSAPESGDAGTSFPSSRWRHDDRPLTQAPEGLSGFVVLDEYDWLASSGAEHLGVVRIDLARGVSARLLSGRYPSRHQQGDIVFAQACGSFATWIARATPEGNVRQLTPCSNSITATGRFPNPRFDVSRLSPDGTRVAAELRWTQDINVLGFAVLVYDMAGTQLARFDGYYAPTWLPDGGLVMARLDAFGLYRTDASLAEPQRIDRMQISSVVNNPMAHPDGSWLVFERDQQLWRINVDGSDARRLLFGDSRIRYPSFSPDGRYLLYLLLSSDDYYSRFLYFTDLQTQENYSYSLDGVIGVGRALTSVVPNGPLSWFR